MPTACCRPVVISDGLGTLAAFSARVIRCHAALSIAAARSRITGSEILRSLIACSTGPENRTECRCVGARSRIQAVSALGIFHLVWCARNRHALYLHDRRCPDRGVFACYCRCAMSGADRVIRRSTAGAVLGIAATLAVNVAHDLGHGLIGDGAPRFPAT